MRMIVIAAALGGAAMLSSCATMTEAECLAGDWERAGFEDGTQGRPASFLERRRRDCLRRANVAPDSIAYERGRQQGLRDYCTPQNAYRIGAAGERYDGVCVGRDADLFLDALELGRTRYGLVAALERLDRDIFAAEDDIDAFGAERADIEARIASEDSTAEERRLLVSDLRELSERRGRAEAEVRRLIEERARVAADLERFDADRPYFGF